MAHMKVEELVEQLKKAYGASLRAVVVYGSAVAGETLKKRSDINVLVLVETLGMTELRAAAAAAEAWGESGNPPPMTMTVEEWMRSSDVFPMEYADILERHKVYFGTPPFDAVTVEKRDLRHQVEQEAMGKLLRFRRGIMAAGGDGRSQLELLEDSLSAMMVLFRGVERLQGEHPGTDYEELATRTAEHIGFQAEPFVRVVRHVRQTKALKPAEAAGVVAGYLEGLEQLVRWLDQHPAE